MVILGNHNRTVETMLPLKLLVLIILFVISLLPHILFVSNMLVLIFAFMHILHRISLDINFFISNYSTFKQSTI